MRTNLLDENLAGQKFQLYRFQDITTQKTHEAHLAELTRTASTFGNDDRQNIEKILALLGEIYGADACLFNVKVGSNLITKASWNAPAGYQEVDKADGHICTDVIRERRADPVAIQQLQQTAYASTDPNVQQYNLQTYLGIALSAENHPGATICMVFTQNREFTESELQLLKLASYVVSNELTRQSQLNKLTAAEANMRVVLENSLDSIWSVDTDFRITYVNEAFRKAYFRAFHVELSEGMHILNTLPQQIRPVWEERYRRGLKGERFVFIDSVPLDNDVAYIEQSVMPIVIDNRVTGISFYGRNITEKYLAEQRLIQSEQRLSQLNAAKDRLFSIISHDLRSPFNNIIGLSEVIEEMAAENGNEALKEYASAILRVSKNTFALLENLLHWSRMQSGKMQLEPAKVSLAHIVAQELEFLHQHINKKLIKITNQVDQGHYVMADAQSLAVIVRNLISNAIKFSHAEGEVVLESELDNAYVLLRVRDFGVGIPADDQKNMFKPETHPTKRGTQNETGTGIGLLLCKELAEKNKGYLLVESRPGKGSTFTLMLNPAG
ncbi:MAG: GAF domain-containing sensor histidine kinase [Bacteroidetes bacterium]|nr:GAF domain-containing sensor histidine kinase [Bacteroidota bacterium]